MKSKWNFMHSSFLSTLLLFLAVGIMLLFHGVQSGALTIPLTKDQTTWVVFLFPWIDALLSWLIQGLVTGAWSTPDLSGLTAPHAPIVPAGTPPPPEPARPVTGSTLLGFPGNFRIPIPPNKPGGKPLLDIRDTPWGQPVPSRPATLTPPPEPDTV